MGLGVSRFFRTSEPLYESVRAQLDLAWGHPTPDGKTATCVAPAAVAPRDTEGRVLLAIQDEFATWEPAASMLPGLLASGAVEEIDLPTYTAAINPAESL